MILKKFMGEEVKIKSDQITQIILYDNPNGSNGTIILSETSANFEYIDIFYKNNYNNYSYVRVYQPHNKSVILNIIALYRHENTYGHTRVVNINGTSISTNNDWYGSMILNTNGYTSYDEALIYITRVVGYK